MIPGTLVFAIFVGQLTGTGDIAAIAGHGGLTAAVNSAGVLAVLRWPNPGGPDQLLQPRAGAIEGGGRWGIRVGDGTHWVGDASARVLEVTTPDVGSIHARIEWSGTSIRANIQFWILDDLPALVSTIDVTGVDAAPVMLWRSDWAPRTHLAAELPFGDGAFDSINGFAAIAEPARVWHVRPSEPDRETLQHARKLATQAAPMDAWAALIGDGIWIGIGSAEAVRIEHGEQAIAELGPIASVVEPRVHHAAATYSARVAVAVAANHSATLATLNEASSPQEPRNLPNVPERIRQLDESRRELPMRCWRTLEALRDPQSGRVVRGLSVNPPLARDWPRYGAWIALAFDAAGESAFAQSILDHYLAAVRDSDAPGQPFGSLPESFYTNGEIASPRFVVDDLGPARMLFAVNRIAQSMTDDARDQWLARRDESIAAAAEFLATWVDSRQGAPLWSPDPVGFSDADTQTRVFDHFAGMNAAISLARALGKPLPEHWLLRRDRLRELVERIVTTPFVGWSPARAVLWEFEGLPPELIDAVLNATRFAVNARAAESIRESANLAIQASLLPDDGATLGLALAQLSDAVIPPDAEIAALLILAGLERSVP